MIKIQLCQLARLFTFARLIDGLSGNQMRIPALLGDDGWPEGMCVIQLRPKNFAVGARNAVPLVEASIRGKTCFSTTEVPLPPNSCGIALCRQELWKYSLPRG